MGFREAMQVGDGRNRLSHPGRMDRMEEGGGGATAAAFVFLTGLAGALAVTGCRDSGRGIDSFVRLPGLFCISGGLEATEFGGGAADEAVGLGTGAVYGGFHAGGGVFFARLVGDEGVDDAAATEAPCGADDFGYVDVFEHAFGAELSPEVGDDLEVELAFLGVYEVAGGEESERNGVAGNPALAFLGAGTGGEVGVVLVGGELGAVEHGMSFRPTLGMGGDRP